MTFTRALATNNYGPAKFIVSANTFEGTHTTIALALTAASSGDTIFIRPGTYTENLTLKAGVNLAAYGSDGISGGSQASNVIILGKATATFAGSCSITGVCLKTNADFCISVTGTANTDIALINCYILANNNTAIESTTTDAQSKISLWYCRVDSGTTGIGLCTNSGAGGIKVFQSQLENNSDTVTAATVSGSGYIDLFNSYCAWPITTSSTSRFNAQYSSFVKPLILNGTGGSEVIGCQISSGASSCISVGTGSTLTISSCTLNSSNTNAITGAGTLVMSAVALIGTGVATNVTTQTSSSQLPLLPGTSGHVLTSNGAGTTPTYQAAGGGGWVKISAQTAATSATIDFTGLTSTYGSYMVIISAMRPADDATKLIMRTSTDNGGAYDAGASDYHWMNQEQATTTITGTQSTGASSIALQSTNLGNAANENGAWVITIYDPTAAQYCFVNYFGQTTSTSGTHRWQSGTGRRVSAADVTAIRFLMDSGNISIGEFILYGQVA